MYGSASATKLFKIDEEDLYPHIPKESQNEPRTRDLSLLYIKQFGISASHSQLIKIEQKLNTSSTGEKGLLAQQPTMNL
jgi:hypothetical protein